MARPSPLRFAIEPQLEVAPEEVLDEDQLNRENDDREEGDCLDLIYTRLRDGDETAARAATALAHSILEMVRAGKSGNEYLLAHWRRVAIVAIDQMAEET